VNDPVEHLRLPNGFDFVYQRSPAAPVLALDLWVRVGSADETATEAGLAHVVEHMLFKGTRRRAPGAIASEVEGLGGEINAYTSFDHTVYTILVASRYAEQGIDILHDAVAHSTFAAEELDREKKVVLEEIKRGRDMPQQYLSRMLFGTRYTRHPYGKPVIGQEETVNGFTHADCLRFVRRWYRPSNMSLVAVGDRPVSELIPLIEKYFGKMAGLAAPRRPNRPAEPRATAFRAAMEPRDVSEVLFDLAFPAPSARHEDVVALDLLTTVLGHGEASRLQHRLKLDLNLVSAISAGSYTPRDPGLLYVGGGAEPKRYPDAWKALCEELFRLVRDPVAPSELQRAKDTLEADFIYQRETVQGQAQKLGYCHVILDDADYERTYLQKLAAATPQMVWDAARKYLTAKSAVLCLVHPRAIDTPLSGEEAEATLREAEAAARREAKPARRQRRQMVRHVLPNGVRVLVRQNPAVPIVALRAAYLGGGLLDPRGRAGSFHLLSECLPRGTGSRSVFDIAHDADRLGGHVEGFSGRNSFGLRAEFLSKHLDKALDLVGDILTNPSFAPEELEKAREDTVAAILRRDDNPAGKAFRTFEKALYGDHPYGDDPLGTLESIALPTSGDLQALYAAYARPEGLALAVVGDVDPDDVVGMLTEKLVFPPGGGIRMDIPPGPRPPARPVLEFVPSTFEQTHIVVGFLGTTIYNDDRVPLRVANALLSGQGGRLFRTLRDDKALAYSVTSTCMYGVERGYLAGYIATSPAQAQAARLGLLAEITKLADSDLSEEEVEAAKRKLAGSYEISLQENTFQAAQMALDEVYGIDYREFLNHAARTLAVTREEVERVAKKYLRPDRWVAAVVGPESR
jgi:zinc protease